MRFAATRSKRLSRLLALTLIIFAFTFPGCKPADTATPPPAGTNALETPASNFPWPPPEASASMVLPKEFLSGATNLSRADAILSSVLIICGYSERSYYQVPGGFALVTRLEQINPDGSSKGPPHRWSLDVGRMEKLTLDAYIKALSTAESGRFRIIVFVVSSYAFAQAPRTTAREKVWLKEGVDTLPGPAGEAAYSNRHACTALVYEFDVPQTQTTAVLTRPSGLSCKVHLEKAMLWSLLAN